MKTKKKKETTINDLSKKIDSLALSMERGFKRADEKMERGFKRADERLETAIDNLAIIVGKGFDHADNRMDSLEQGQDDIKMRLDNVAYRFELVDLQKRVEVLERRSV